MRLILLFMVLTGVFVVAIDVATNPKSWGESRKAYHFEQYKEIQTRNGTYLYYD